MLVSLTLTIIILLIILFCIISTASAQYHAMLFIFLVIGLLVIANAVVTNIEFNKLSEKQAIQLSELEQEKRGELKLIIEQE